MSDELTRSDITWLMRTVGESRARHLQKSKNPKALKSLIDRAKRTDQTNF